MSTLEPIVNKLRTMIDRYVSGLCDVQQTVADEAEDTNKECEAKIDKLDRATVTKADLRLIKDARCEKLMDCFKLEIVRQQESCSFRVLRKVYSYWSDKIFAKRSSKSLPELLPFTDVPIKLASMMMLNGDYYKALLCLKQVIKIRGNCVEARIHYLKWTAYLAEWEMLEAALKEEKKLLETEVQSGSKRRKRLAFIVQVTTAFAQFHRGDGKGTKKKSVNVLTNLLNEAISSAEPTFESSEKLVMLRYFCSFLGRVANPSKDTLDPLWCLTQALYKSEGLVRSHLVGLFKDNERIDFVPPNRNCLSSLEVGSSVAEYFDICHSLTLEQHNAGMVRELLGTTEYQLMTALKLALVHRVQQAYNQMALIRKYIMIEDCSLALPSLRARMIKLYASSLEVKSSTPMASPSRRSRTKSPSRLATTAPGVTPRSPARTANCKSPSRLLSTPSRIVTSIADQMRESFVELKVTRPSETELHRISDKCDCDTCAMYHSNPHFAMEYQMSKFLLGGNKEMTDQIGSLTEEFAKIRERVIPDQVTLMAKNARPRPPPLMCEMYCLICIRWLRQLEQNGKLYLTDSAISDLRASIIDSTIKIASYSPLHCLCYRLAVSHLNRDVVSSFPGNTLSWMCATQSQRGLRSCNTGFTSALEDTLVAYGGDEWDGTKSKDADAGPSVGSLIKAKVPADMVAKVVDDYSKYHHVMYRDWRFPVTSFVGRFSKDPWLAAMMWTESAVLTSRWQARQKDGILGDFSFKNAAEFEAAIKDVPRDFTVIQLASDSDGHLHLIKLHREKKPIIMPLAHHTKVAKLFAEMKRVLKDNDSSSEKFEKTNGVVDSKRFWDNRRRIETDLRKIVHGGEVYLFDTLLPMMLPSLSLGPRGRKVAEDLVRNVSTETAPLDESLAQELLSLCSMIEKDIWYHLVNTVGSFYELAENQIRKLQSGYDLLRQKISVDGAFNKAHPNYVFLIVSPVLASFPFESMRIFDEKCYVGRLPSVHALVRILRNSTTMPRKVHVENSYYVLDPENNLGHTKDRMSEFIQKFAWKGMVGAAPTGDDVKEMLSERDMFFYFGHGCGSKYLGRRTIKESTCNAVTVLMGCGSVELDYEGWGMDGKCTVYDYTIARCPCIVGCLWMVTDGEIDRYFMALVELCFVQKANETMDEGAPRLRVLMEAMKRAKQSVKLPFLTGSAVVSYGLPIVSSD